MAKMLVPIAHASNGQKSFFAAICSGNQVVIAVNVSFEDKPASIKGNSKCPLCSIIEQDTALTQPNTLGLLAKAHSVFLVRDSLIAVNIPPLNHVIRAPPTLS